MGTITNAIDLSGVTSGIHRLERKMTTMEAELQLAKAQMQEVRKEMNGVSKELAQLRKDFETWMVNQQKQAALQEALTELVRIRQELDHKYGNYRTIRETMIGILQATDAALVKKTTVSTVSEELMLSSPNYWLAPCLVAVAAWIGNDRDLANRAIAEAVKRDEERTALVMALICRRNNRVDACYEWLSVYFSNQNANHFSEGSFVYVDAYVNGVFGPDRMHMCDDYVNKWMAELQHKKKNLAKEQSQLWKDYCRNYVQDVDRQYPALKELVPEFKGINSYMKRMNSVEALSGTFEGMKTAEVDQDVLREMIDSNLIDLVQRHNEDEAPLRKEEAYYAAVKKYRGDEAAAEREVAVEQQRHLDRATDLVGQMVEAIKGGTEISLSQKRTAVTFLEPYIEQGMREFVSEKRGSFPETITIPTYGFRGTTKDGSNEKELVQQFLEKNEQERKEQVTRLQNQKQTPLLVAGIIAIVLGLLSGLIFVGAPIGAILLIRAFNNEKVKEKRIGDLNRNFDDRAREGQKQIEDCIRQWKDARMRVLSFDEKKELIA